MSKEKKPNDGSTRTVTCGNTTLTLTKRDGQVSQVLADISRELLTYLNSVKNVDQQLKTQLNILTNSLATGSREVLAANDKVTLNTALQKCLELEKNGNPKTKDKIDATKVLNTICCRMFGKGFSDTGQFLASALAALVYAGDPTTIYTACTSDTAAAIGLLLPPFSFFCRKNGKSWDKYFLLIDFQITRYLSLKSATLKQIGETKFSETINISPSPLGMSSFFNKYNSMSLTQGFNMMLMDIRDLKRRLQSFAVSYNLELRDYILQMNEISLIAFVKNLDKSRLEPWYDAIINDVSSLEKLYNLCKQIQDTIFVGDNEYDTLKNYDSSTPVFDVPIWLLELFISKYKTQIYSKKSEEQLKREALRAGIIDCLKGHDFGLDAVLLYKRDFFTLFTPNEWRFLETSGSGDDIVLEFADTFIGSGSCLVNSKEVLESGILKCKFNSLKEKIYMEQVVGRSDISSKSDGSDIISCVPGVNKVVVSQDFTSTKTFGEDAHAMQLQNAIQLVDKYFKETDISQQSCPDFIIKNKNKIIPFIVVLKSKEEDYDSANTGIRLGISQFDDVDTSINMSFKSEPPPPIRTSAFKVVTNGPASGLLDPVEVYLKMVFNNMHTSVFPEQWRTGLLPFKTSSKDDNIWFLECLQQIILDTKNDAISGLSVVKQKVLLKKIIKNANSSIASTKKNSASSKKGKDKDIRSIEANDSQFDSYFKEWNEDYRDKVNNLKILIENISQVTEDQIKKDPNQILLNFINKFTDILNAATFVDDDRLSLASKCLIDSSIQSPGCRDVTSSCAILSEISGSNRTADRDKTAVAALDLLKNEDDDRPPEEKRSRPATTGVIPSCIPDKTFTTAILGFFTSIVDGMPTKEEAQINHQNKETQLIKNNNKNVDTAYLTKMTESGITDSAMQTAFEECLRILQKIEVSETSSLEASELNSNPQFNKIMNIIYDIKKLLPKSLSFLEFAKAILTIIHDENNFGPIDEIYHTLGIFNNSTREVFLIIWLFNVFNPFRANEISSDNVAQLLKGIDKDDIERIGFVNMDAINIELENEFLLLSKTVNRLIDTQQSKETIQTSINALIIRMMYGNMAYLIPGITNKVGCSSRSEDLSDCLYNYILKERQNTLTSGEGLQLTKSNISLFQQIPKKIINQVEDINKNPEKKYTSGISEWIPKQNTSLISTEQRGLAQEAKEEKRKFKQKQEAESDRPMPPQKKAEKRQALQYATEQQAAAIGNLLEAKRQGNDQIINEAQKAVREAIINMSRLQIEDIPEDITIEEQNEILMYLMAQIDDLNKVSDVFNVLLRGYIEENSSTSNKGSKRKGHKSFFDMSKEYIDSEKNESPPKMTKIASISPLDEALNIAFKRYPNSEYLNDQNIKNCLSSILDLIESGSYTNVQQLKRKINENFITYKLNGNRMKVSFILDILLLYYQHLENNTITQVISDIIKMYSQFIGGSHFTRGRHYKVKRFTKGRKLNNQKRKSDTKKINRKKNKTRRH